MMMVVDIVSALMAAPSCAALVMIHYGSQDTAGNTLRKTLYLQRHSA